jgi:5-methylcytosine-specific restriction endonuclease McrA
MPRNRKSGPWIAKHADQAIPESAKRHILERQTNAAGLVICPDCGQPIRIGQKKAFDHEKPLIEGGLHGEENLRAIHEKPCHQIKTAAEARARTKERSQFAAMHGIKGKKPGGFKVAHPQQSASRKIRKFSPIDGIYEIEEQP